MRTLAAVLITLVLAASDPPSWGERREWAADAGPAAREHASFVAAASGDHALLFGGSGYAPYGTPLDDAWRLDLADDTWRRVELTGDVPTAGGSRRVAPCDGGALLHGGYAEGFAPVGGLWRLTWRDEDVVASVAVTQRDAPSPRLLHGFAHDATGARLVVFGGVGAAGALDDTHLGTFDDAGVVTWTELDLDASPGPRFGFAHAFDTAARRLLVLGGQVPTDDGSLAFACDLWALDLSGDAPRWTKLADDVDPTGRRNPAWAYDDASGRLLVWGGTSDGAAALPGLLVVETRGDVTSTTLAEDDATPVRASAFGLVDAPRRRALLGFGNTATAAYADLVEVLLAPR